MINHFYAHKQEFEALVKTAVTYDEKWELRPDVKALRKKTGIYQIIGGIGRVVEDPGVPVSEWYQQYIHYKDIPSKKLFHEKARTHALIIKMQGKRGYYANYLLHGGLNYKDYVYFHNDRIPGPPVNSFYGITGYGPYDRISWKIRDDGTEDGPHLRVMESLDSLMDPWFFHSREKLRAEAHRIWGKHTCVVKKIEPHWFLRRCRVD